VRTLMKGALLNGTAQAQGWYQDQEVPRRQPTTPYQDAEGQEDPDEEVAGSQAQQVTGDQKEGQLCNQRPQMEEDGRQEEKEVIMCSS
jgi:hypothetical protein